MNIRTLEKRIDRLEKIVDPKTEMNIIFVSNQAEADEIESELDDDVLNVILIRWND